MLKSDRCHKNVHNRLYLLLSEMRGVYERIRTELLPDFMPLAKTHFEILFLWKRPSWQSFEPQAFCFPKFPCLLLFSGLDIKVENERSKMGTA